MSVDLLREAAKVMRERAQAATGGPWRRYGMAGVSAPQFDVVAEVPIVCEECDRRVAVTGCGTNEDAEHVASWHPAVALAVADWLDYAADVAEHVAARGNRPAPNGYTSRALAVARAYLGEAS